MSTMLPKVKKSRSDLFGVGNIRTTVAGVSHFVSISIFLVGVGNPFAVIQMIGDS